MKIYSTKYLGYCFGVSNAIKIAKQVRDNYYDRNVYIFGELVHNSDVTKELEKLNIHTVIPNSNPEEELNKFKRDDIVIFTAHGHNAHFDKILSNKGIITFDAICPRVKLNNQIIRKYLKQGEVIYIGKKNHPETKAAISISPRIHFFDINEKMDFKKIASSNPLVINQTTISITELKEVHQIIKREIPNAIFNDEICPITRNREEEILLIPSDVDLIIIIGSENSSNTDKLYRLSISSHPNIKVIKVQNLDELKTHDLNSVNYVAISSGTSTPMKIIDEIKDYLKELN